MRGVALRGHAAIVAAALATSTISQPPPASRALATLPMNVRRTQSPAPTPTSHPLDAVPATRLTLSRGPSPSRPPAPLAPSSPYHASASAASPAGAAAGARSQGGRAFVGGASPARRTDEIWPDGLMFKARPPWEKVGDNVSANDEEGDADDAMTAALGLGALSQGRALEGKPFHLFLDALAHHRFARVSRSCLIFCSWR